MTNTVPMPTWVRLLAVLALFWNLLGMASYFMFTMMTPQQLAQLPPDRLSLIEATPDWVGIAYAMAVFGGTIGSLLLVFGRGLAVLAFLISLAGILAQHTHTFLLSRASEIISPFEKGLAIAVIIIGLYLLVLSLQSKNRGWIS